MTVGENQDIRSIQRLRRVGTVLFFTIAALVLSHVVLQVYVNEKQWLASELREMLVEQRSDMERIGRNAQEIVMLRQSSSASKALIRTNRTFIQSLQNIIKERDLEIDRIFSELDVWLFPTDTARLEREAYKQVAQLFLARVSELASIEITSLSNVLSLPDLMIAPHGVLISSLKRLNKISRVFEEKWQKIELAHAFITAFFTLTLIAVLIFRYFHPLVSRAQKDFEKLQSGLDVRTRYFYQMSHELRTPLNAICGYAGLLQHNAKMSEDINAQTYADHVLEAGERLTSRIDNILLLTELQTGTYPIHSETFDLMTVVQECVGEITSVSGSRHIEILDLRPSMITWVTGDRTALQTILRQLLRNSLAHAQDKCGICLQGDGETMIVDVVDDGPGIASEHLTRILEPFHTITNSIFESDTGTGVGLTIVKMLADLSDITLSLQPNRPSGLCVRLEFSVQSFYHQVETERPDDEAAERTFKVRERL